MVLERGIVTPLVLGLGVSELLVLLAVMLLLFGTGLAGLGKCTGRAFREFEEETKGLRSNDSQPPNPGLGGAYPDRNGLSAFAAGRHVGAAAQQRHLPAAAAVQPRSLRHRPAQRHLRRTR